MRQASAAPASRAWPANPAAAGERVLFMPSSLIMGGSERKTVRVVNALVARGRQAGLAYLNEPHTLLAEIAAEVPLHYFDREGKFSPAAAWRVADYLKRERITHFISVNLYPTLYAASAAVLQPWARPPRLSVLINSTHFLDPMEEAQMRIYAPILRRAANLVFGCQYHQDLWTDKYALDPARCRIIHNGVDQTLFSSSAVDQPRAKVLAGLDIAPASFVVTTVGRLVGEKRQLDLVQAVGRLASRGHDVVAVIVGEGPERGSLASAVEQGGWHGAVRLVGLHQDVRPILAASDAFSLNSSHETFSNAALEAMAMALPVVMSDLPSAREMVVDGDNGLLYPVGDVEALEAALLSLMKAPAKRQRMALSARRVIETRFSFDRMVDEYERLAFGG